MDESFDTTKWPQTPSQAFRWLDARMRLKMDQDGHPASPIMESFSKLLTGAAEDLADAEEPLKDWDMARIGRIFLFPFITKDAAIAAAKKIVAELDAAGYTLARKVGTHPPAMDLTE